MVVASHHLRLSDCFRHGAAHRRRTSAGLDGGSRDSICRFGIPLAVPHLVCRRKLVAAAASPPSCTNRLGIQRGCSGHALRVDVVAAGLHAFLDRLRRATLSIPACQALPGRQSLAAAAVTSRHLRLQSGAGGAIPGRSGDPAAMINLLMC